MSKINCEVIEDLLPLYVEGLTSPSSCQLVEEHLDGCEACRQKNEQMRQGMELPKEVDPSPLQGIRRTLFRKKTTAVVLAVLGVLLLTVLCLVHLNSPITIPYETVADTIQVEKDENGNLYVSLEDMGGEVDLEYDWDGDGTRILYINAHTTRLRQVQSTPSRRQMYAIGEENYALPQYFPEGFEWEDIETSTDQYTVNIRFATLRSAQRIYYYPSAQNGETVLVWEDPELKAGYHSLGIVLPRLTLNYYTIIAAVLSGIGLICCLVYRKKGRSFYRALRLTALPICYVTSSMCILWQHEVIYDALYYLSGILLTTLVLYMIVLWVIQYTQYRKSKLS